MSRSRHHGCGRGCGVCGDAGEARRDRETDAALADERELLEEIDPVTAASKDADFTTFEEALVGGPYCVFCNDDGGCAMYLKMLGLPALDDRAHKP